MHNRIGQRIERNLTDEIKNLKSDELEYVGHHMISVMEGKRLIHHGLNQEGRPSGYTVDTFSSDGVVVGEYSVDKSYFTDYKKDKVDESYEKIRNDVEHALSHSGNVQKIYLISSQEEVPSFRKHFNSTRLYQNNGEKIEIYDCREMAKEIYRQSKNNIDDAAFYKGYFPNFSQELDNYEYYGKIPSQCNHFCPDQKILKKIEAHYGRGKSLCVLHGISGSGKTQMAIAYIHAKSQEFQNYIWIAGEDWRKGTTLSSIQRTRGGTPINVVGLFNYSKTILVIDSLERQVDREEFSELQEGFDKGGIVFITSQIGMKRDYYLQIPEFSEDVAKKILGEEDNEEELVNSLIKKCKSFPIILSTIRNMITYEGIGREDLYEEILENPDGVAGPDGSSIIHSILSKLGKKTLDSLKKIANSGITTFDIEFIREYCGRLSSSNLQQLSILITTNTPGIVKIHDLICVAMKDADDETDIVTFLEQYIENKRGEMTPSILRQICLLRSQIRRYKSENTESDWLTYGLLQIEGDEKNELIEKLYRNTFAADTRLSAEMCFIEAKELKAYQIDEKEELEEYFRYLIDEYLQALKLYNDADRKAALLHHLGKAYRRCGRYTESHKIFSRLLKVKPHLYATYGQIITLGTMKVSPDIKRASEDSMRILIKDMLEDAAQIPLRVSLAAIARMRSYRNIVNEMIDSEDKVDLLCQIVASSALEDIGQFFEGFVSISSIFSYHYNEKCILLAESVPDMIMVEPAMIEDKQWLNACEALANIAVAANRQKKGDLFALLINKSIEFGEAYLREKKLNGYAARAIAKSYIINGQGERAIEVIGQIPYEQRDHWILYRQAEAENQLGLAQAVDTIQRAIGLLEMDERNANRKASYLHLLSRCYSTQNEREKAKEIIDEAIGACEDTDYLLELKEYRTIISEF